MVCVFTEVLKRFQMMVTSCKRKVEDKAMNEVIFSVNEKGLAIITLNRPKAINALSYEMIKAIKQKLEEWETDDNISVVVVRGAGEKGLCAGGDIKAVYEACSSQSALQDAKKYFELEYSLDMDIYRFPKPIIACLDGIVMGGGVGLTYGASHRIVTERTKWSMPEMNISLFPDVGAGYFLNKAPGYIGRYLALTASVIESADVLYINGADTFMSSEKMQSFLHDIEEVNWRKSDVASILNERIKNYAGTSMKESKLAAIQKEIDLHFSFQTVEEIVQSLDNATSDFARETKESILLKSPLSLKVTLKHMVDGAHKTLEECFATDLILAKNFLTQKDFYEGVRSVLIDKDRNPKYEYKQLGDVSESIVNRFFLLQ